LAPEKGGSNLHEIKTLKMTQKEKVTMIGLGSMGSALSKTMLKKNYDVTIWNRDQSKTAALAAMGAKPAQDIIAAVRASPVLIICVSDYKATQQVFEAEGVSALMREHTIIQLSTGTPKQARELAIWAEQHGASCLNGDILAWPRQIGTTEATISVCGNQHTFQRFERMLCTLGTINYLGEEAGASAVLFSAVMAYLAGNWIGFCHGALICESEGYRPADFGDLIRSISPMLAEESRHMGQVIQRDKFIDPESTIRTTALDLHLLAQHADEAGINNELPAFAASIFQRAIDAGYGGEEHAAIIKVLRQAV
jgi:3-hydroxyisobutyrate dehydrogenase-like beta-hydroxyacid dehydrogenase